MPPEQSLFACIFSSSRSLSPASSVPGLLLAENALTKAEELALLRAVDDSPVAWTRRRTRVTKNYGPYYLFNERDTPEGRFRYTDGKVKNTPLPDFLHGMIMPILYRALPELICFSPNQLHVALYRKGEDHKIRMHNDNKMGELGPYIVGMCLKGDANMTFVRPSDGRKRVVHLPRRCVYAMTGESHREWRHGILSGNSSEERVSFTLRDVRKLAVEEGTMVKKSRFMPSEEAIKAQRRKDIMKMAGYREDVDYKLVNESG